MSWFGSTKNWHSTVLTGDRYVQILKGSLAIMVSYSTAVLYIRAFLAKTITL